MSIDTNEMTAETTTSEPNANHLRFNEVMQKPTVRALDAIEALGRYTGKSFVNDESVDKLVAILHAEVDKMATELRKKPVRPGSRVVTLY